MVEQKAVAIPQRHKKMCDICMLLDIDANGTKFHLYDEGCYPGDEDKYVCDKCVDDLKDIRRKCYQKIDNPHHKIFKDFVPWFAKDIPGMMNAFKKHNQETT